MTKYENLLDRVKTFNTIYEGQYVMLCEHYIWDGDKYKLTLFNEQNREQIRLIDSPDINQVLHMFFTAWNLLEFTLNN